MSVEDIKVNGNTVSFHIERLIVYGLHAGLIGAEDYFVVRNALFQLFDVKRPTSDRVYRRDKPELLRDVLGDIVECGVLEGLCGGSAYEREQFGAKVMGLLTPRQSEVYREFWERHSKSPAEATDYFFALSKATAYVREGNSLRWTADTDAGELEITINLSKPEKDPRKIAADGAVGASLKKVYPKCLICAQNAGYSGREGFPARENHRIIKIKNLGAASRHWYLQYSPYQYYNEHCIVLFENHVPMKLDGRTFEALFDFVDLFPHYFIGSNADLPIVGGSILSHEHYQGGCHSFAIERAKVMAELVSWMFAGVGASVLNWPLSTLRLCGTDRSAISAAALHILEAWKSYSDDGIVPFTTESVTVERGGKTFEEEREVPHNTVTPILRMRDGAWASSRGVGCGEEAAPFYELDLVLRNNLTSEEHPLGIYHPHSDVWHIKKENIGLIEVMGLAVLPPRLAAETAKIEEILRGLLVPSESGFYEENPELLQHKDWIEALLEKYGSGNAEDTARGLIQSEVGLIFERVLSDCGVFKPDNDGLLKFLRFLASAGWKRVG